MATVGSYGKDGKGKRVLFVHPDGSQRTIRLGKITQRQAEAFSLKVDNLVGKLATGQSDPETERWVAGLDDALHERLAAVGLVESRRRTNAKLSDFLEEFFSSVPVKPGTRTTYLQTKRSLVDYFGSTIALRSIGPAEADRWRDWLRDHEKLAQATISKRIKTARQAFRRAVRWKLIADNPFVEVVAGAQTNKARQHFVAADVAARVLEHCPDAEWKLLFALSRYGGLRCPSEPLALKWSDVDWERNRLRVTSCKTEHLDGGDSRIMPIFPELMPYLQAAFDEAPDGAEYVIRHYRDAAVNLRTQLGRIIRRAKLKPWPKLWHNLRATRQTELAAVYPIHLVCEWLGNSRAVAQAHYLQVTDADYSLAAQTVTAKAAQNAAQSNAITPNQQESSESKQEPQTLTGQGLTRSDEMLPTDRLTPTGFEPVLPA